MRLSVIVPALDEEPVIEATLRSLSCALGERDEILVADGGSTDRTSEIASRLGATVIRCDRGRGRQMNEAASHAAGDVLLFVHADTTLPPDFRTSLGELLADPRIVWGRFDLRFDEGGRLLRLIAWLISTRSRIFCSATGDQAIFVRRADFDALGGYLEPLLFEDVDLARRLRSRGAMGVPRGCATTSARRWRNRGVWSTTLRMWTLKTLYLCGVPAARLAGHYRDER